MKTILCKLLLFRKPNKINSVFYLASHGVAVIDDINLINKISSKKAIIEQARQWPTYFCRFFPVSVYLFS
jgi:hypothetical protein